jgi:hypothetical protein
MSRQFSFSADKAEARNKAEYDVSGPIVGGRAIDGTLQDVLHLIQRGAAFAQGGKVSIRSLRPTGRRARNFAHREGARSRRGVAANQEDVRAASAEQSMTTKTRATAPARGRLTGRNEQAQVTEICLAAPFEEKPKLAGRS